MKYRHHPQFFTATILEWKYLLQIDKYKQIIIDTLEWLVMNNRVTIFAFVIMPNHFHVLWHIHDAYAKDEVQSSLLKLQQRNI